MPVPPALDCEPTVCAPRRQGWAKTERTAALFKLLGLHPGRPITAKRVSRIVSEIGGKAGAVVNTEGKSANAHDFRRSSGTRWAKRVMPAVLQQLMRHGSIETTLRYYVDLDADELAEELWNAHGGKPAILPAGTAPGE